MKAKSTQSRERGQGENFPLRGQGAELPCGVWGNAPTVLRATNPKEVANKGAGSEASLPVTLRIRRCAPNLLYPLLAHCRAKWARPDCWSCDHSYSSPQAEDFASAEATRGQWKRTKSAIAPLTPSVPPLLGLSAAEFVRSSNIARRLYSHFGIFHRKIRFLFRNQYQFRSVNRKR